MLETRLSDKGAKLFNLIKVKVLKCCYSDCGLGNGLIGSAGQIAAA